MKTNGQYRPTVNDIVEAQQQNEELASKTSLLWSIIVWRHLDDFKFGNFKKQKLLKPKVHICKHFELEDFKIRNFDNKILNFFRFVLFVFT
jgi:hypothetical protein